MIDFWGAFISSPLFFKKDKSNYAQKAKNNSLFFLSGNQVDPILFPGSIFSGRFTKCE